MRKSILSILLICMITSVGFAQTENMEEEITEKERAMYEAIQAGDMSVFEANLADDFKAIYSDGIISKEEQIEELGNLTMNSYELSNTNIMSPAENVAVIVYEVYSEGEYMGEPFSGTYYSSSIWAMMDGEWKAIMHTETRSEPAEATAETMEEDDDWNDEENEDDEEELEDTKDDEEDGTNR